MGGCVGVLEPAEVWPTFPARSECRREHERVFCVEHFFAAVLIPPARTQPSCRCLVCALCFCVRAAAGWGGFLVGVIGVAVDAIAWPGVQAIYSPVGSSLRGLVAAPLSLRLAFKTGT